MKSSNEPDDDTLEVEVNEKQAIFLEAVYNTRFKIAAMIGGRGSGKSVTLSDFLLLASDELPKCKCGWGVPTIKKAKSKLTSGLKAGWKRHGITEYDFKTGTGLMVMWREPPAHFDRPYEAPDIWENCISFPNGFVIEFESFKMAAAENRGANYDLYVIDEGLNFKKEWLKVVLPTLRANENKGIKSTFHQMLAVFSSPPWDLAGQWMYEIEELAKTEPDRYFFMEVKTKDNLAFLPSDYLDTLKKNLTRLEYQVEVEGKRLSKMPHNFYPSFQHTIHVLKEESDEYENRAAWSGETLYNPGVGLEASLDFNAHFTSATLWQSDWSQARLVDNLYCKEPTTDAAGVAMTMAQTLATQIAADYAGHQKKEIVLTGDRNGKNKSAGSTKSMFEQVAEILEANGWKVMVSPLNYNPPHIDKFKDLNNVFAERDPEQIRVRVDGIRCKATVISMDNSPVNTDYTKSKKSESSKIDQELATHLSDTVDYYILWKLKGGKGFSGGGGDFDMDFI